MTKKIFFCVLVCFLSLANYAQKCVYTFKGTVTDYHDGTPIFGAAILIKNLNKYTTSDFEGKFKITNLCKGELTLIISHISCETKEVSIDLKDNLSKDFFLEHHIESLNEINVTAGLNVKSKTLQTSVLKVDKIDTYSNLNLGDALKEIAGVSSINTGSTIVKPIINGLHSSRVIVMANGVRLQDQEWGIEHAPNIDINTAEKITVVKGANSLEFGGDAIGGVIITEPSKVILKDSLYGKTIVSGQTNGRGFSFHSSISKSTKKGWYVNAKSTLKRFGDFETPDYVLTNTGLNSKAFSIQTGLKKFESGFNLYYTYIHNEIGILRASHLGNIEDLVNAINTPKPLVINDFSYEINAPRQDITHQLVKADYYKRFKKLGKLTIQYDFQDNQRFEFDVRIGDDRNKPAIDLNLTSHSIKTSFEFDAKSDQTYKVGVLGAYQNNFANPNTGVRRLIPDFNKYDVGIFTIGNFVLNDKTTVDVGLRYDYNSFNAKKFYLKSRWNERNYDAEFNDLIIGDFNTQWLVNPKFDYHNVSTSAGISYQLNEENAVLFNYALSNRAPNPSELFSDGLHHSAARIELGDLRIQQETSNRFATSYNFKNDNTAVLVELFFNHINNFIYIEPNGTEQTIRGAFPVWAYKKTTANLFGIDVSFEQQINNQFLFNNKSSFIRGKDLDNNRDLIDIPAARTVNEISFKKEKWHHFNANLASEFVFKQNLFPNNNFETYIPTTDTNVLVDVSSTPESYHLLNFNADATFKLSKKTKLTIGINVTNIMNTNYREYLNRLRYFADDLGRNYVLQLKFNY
ncbi:TonB-dependent receptor [uncultured Polaribacter sp.]|uniref:TonB-dependent receptor n=1 Tax=uncultured Polaribacter sp. TaxID=174711 RepID=UPI00262525E4|nr:TonB-dependent receptor [uncultured Polaribacter sp.]